MHTRRFPELLPGFRNTQRLTVNFLFSLHHVNVMLGPSHTDINNINMSLSIPTDIYIYMSLLLWYDHILPMCFPSIPLLCVLLCVYSVRPQLGHVRLGNRQDGMKVEFQEFCALAPSVWCSEAAASGRLRSIPYYKHMVHYNTPYVSLATVWEATFRFPEELVIIPRTSHFLRAPSLFCWGGP